MNIAQLAIKLNIDAKDIPSALRGVEVNFSSSQKRLQVETKRTAQEGVLAMRLFSEGLDLGLSRPLTRFLSQTFPALSKAFGSLVGLGAIGAGAYYGMMAFDHLSKKIEEAKKRQEEFREASQKVGTTLENIQDSYALKLAQLAGRKGMAAFIAEGAQEARKHWEELGKQIDDVEKKRVGTQGFWQNTLSGWGDIGHKIMNQAPADKANEQGAAERDRLQKGIDQAFRQDTLKGTHTALELIKADMRDLTAELIKQSALENKQAGPGYGSLIKEGMAAKRAALDAEGEMLDRAREIEQMREAQEKAQADADKKALGLRRGEELRNEIEERHRLAQSSLAAAAAAELNTAATGKGTAASIAAAAAAEAQRKIEDQKAQAATKFYAEGGGHIADDPKYKAGQAADEADIRAGAAREQRAKAQSEYNQAIAEFNQKTREHVAELDAEAAGTGRVAAEQARQAAGLIPLRERYEGLYGKTTPEPRPAIGPPTAQQSDYAALQGAEAGVSQEQGKTQATAFAQELAKVKAAVLQASDPSPWNRTESKLAELKTAISGTPEQMAQLAAAMHAADAAGALEKLKSKVEELRAVEKALLAGSPYPKIEAEVAKLASDYHISADEARALLTTTQQLEASNKAREAVRAIQPGGAGSRVAELQREADAVREMAAENKNNEDVQVAARLRLQEITAEEDSILLKTGDVGAGFRAWLDALQAVESEGQIVFALLDQASKGFETTAADALVKIIETHRDQHQKLIHELRAMWESYFAGLAKMAISKGLSKLLAPVAGSLEKMLGIAPKVSKDAALATNTTALGANTTALDALIAAINAKGLGGGGGGLGGLIPGGGGGFGGGDAGAGDLGGASADGSAFAAEGGDFSPGGSFISGEAGAERVDLERGGAHVTPLGFSMGGGGGDTHNHYDMRGAVVTDDLMRKAEAAAMMQHTETSAIAKAVSISREAGLRARPQR